MPRKSIPPKVIINFEESEANFEEVVKACTEMVLLIAQWDIPDEKYKNLLRKKFKRPIRLKYLRTPEYTKKEALSASFKMVDFTQRKSHF